MVVLGFAVFGLSCLAVAAWLAWILAGVLRLGRFEGSVGPAGSRRVYQRIDRAAEPLGFWSRVGCLVAVVALMGGLGACGVWVTIRDLVFA